jgi:hypothetical protein
MNITPLPALRKAAMLVLFCLFAVRSIDAGRAHAAVSKPSLQTVINRLSDGTVPSRSSVEKRLGVKLIQSDGSESFVIFTSSVRSLADARLREVELRVARKGAEVTAGPLLILRVDNTSKRCVDRSATLKTYGPLELSQVPSGTSSVVFSHDL